FTGVTPMRPASSSSTCCASAEVNLARRSCSAWCWLGVSPFGKKNSPPLPVLTLTSSDSPPLPGCGGGDSIDGSLVVLGRTAVSPPLGTDDLPPGAACPLPPRTI